MALPPSVWGPVLWEVLHAVGAQGGRSPASIRGDEERELKWLFNNLESVIPCAECRKHLAEYRRAHPVPDAAEGFAVWAWTFHNAVNERLGKAQVPFTQVLSTENPKELWKKYISILRNSIKADYIHMFGRHLRLWASFAGV